jgi:Uma2 family endonuclease
MSIAAERRLAISIEAFRAFYESRPDEEHWELIDGVPMMMAPATKAHQRIASNLERLLNDALDHHNPALAAYQRLGMNLRPVVDRYDPEPDVVVVDAEGGFEQRYVDRFYLAAEVVSDSDGARVELKRNIYKQHPHCRCVLTVRQDRQEVQIDLRSDAGWQVSVIQQPTDVLALDEFGVRCTLADLYRGTPLQPRRPSHG